MLAFDFNYTLNQGIFSNAIAQENFELGFYYLKVFLQDRPYSVYPKNIDQVDLLCSMPVTRQAFRKVFTSNYIYDYLNIFADNKELAMKHIDENDLNLFKSQLKWNPNEERKRKEKSSTSPNGGGGGGGDDDDYDYDYDYFEPKSFETLFHGYYLYNISNKHFGTKIHKFNSLFKDDSGTYVLDELVNVLSVDQIKKLNDKGYVIGKYFHMSSYYGRPSYWSNPLDKITHKDTKEFITKNCKKNMYIKIIKDFNYSDRNNVSFALKHALVQYKLTNGANEEMIGYLVDILSHIKDEIRLFIPQVVWALLKCFPPTHKFVKAFVADKKAFKDYVLFNANIPVSVYINESAYEIYPPKYVKMLFNSCIGPKR